MSQKPRSSKQQSKFTHPSTRVARKMAADPQVAYNTYLEILMRTSYHLARRLGYQHHIADEISVLVSEKFANNAAANMERYPSATVYARVTTWHVAISFDRTERAQRCEGAVLSEYIDTDGVLVRAKARTWISGHAPVLGGEGQVWDLLASTDAAFDHRIVEIDEAQHIVDLCFRGLTERQIDWVMRVDGCGEKITHVARSENFERETVQREIGIARNIIRANRKRLDLVGLASASSVS